MGGQASDEGAGMTRGTSAEATVGGPVGDERDVALEGRSFVEAEHRELRRLVDRTGETAELVCRIEPDDAAHELRALLDALDERLVPHMEWEAAFCYPQLDRNAGTPWVTRLLREQHRQIRARIARLEGAWAARRGDPVREHQSEFRAQLLGLADLLNSHCEQEELVLPLLDDSVDESAPAAIGVPAAQAS